MSYNIYRNTLYAMFIIAYWSILINSHRHNLKSFLFHTTFFLSFLVKYLLK